MERSSSQIRRLGMCASSDQPDGRRLSDLGRGNSNRGGLSQAKDEGAALLRLGPDKHFAFVRLNNLVNDGQPKSSAALELRLERLENLFHHLRTHARAGIGEAELPLVLHFVDADGQGAALFRGAEGVLTAVQED